MCVRLCAGASERKREGGIAGGERATGQGEAKMLAVPMPMAVPLVAGTNKGNIAVSGNEARGGVHAESCEDREDRATRTALMAGRGRG